MTTDLDRIGGLSMPDKMPCASWSIPAIYCKLGSKLARLPGTTCSRCYAMRGMYTMPNVKQAMQRRWDLLQEALSNPVARAEFVTAFVRVLSKKARTTRQRLAQGRTVRRDGRYFRWLDSGDLQSADHLRLLCEIAENVPEVAFWLPTREEGFVRQYLSEDGTVPRNLTVRISVPRMNHRPSPGTCRLIETNPRIAASGVVKDAEIGETCIAYDQGGHCLDCRRCWDANRVLISYPLH